MTTTEHYELKKPDGSDFYDIADFNYNADAIDDALHEIDTNKVPAARKVNNKPLSADITLDASDVGALPENIDPSVVTLYTNLDLISS